LNACSSSVPKEKSFIPTAPGTVVAADSILVDSLNHFHFTLTITTTKYSDTGAYNVIAEWGHDMATDALILPHGIANSKIVIHKSEDEPNTYIVGFMHEGKFYDYYQVGGSRGKIEMKYIKSYSFD
jgi:hypothetical protein